MSARTGYRGRSPLFYRQLKNISGLILLSPETRSDNLIESSVAVATISGTVGFEASCVQKNVFFLARHGLKACLTVMILKTRKTILIYLVYKICFYLFPIKNLIFIKLFKTR